MREHEKKEYVRVCRNHHAQFAGNFHLRVGTIYGRIWSNRLDSYVFFASTDRKEIRGTKEIRVWIRIGNDETQQWWLEKIPIDCRIGQMIFNCASENGNPTVGSYNLPRNKKSVSQMDIIEINGKRYMEYPTEFPLQDVHVPKELRGIVPGVRKSGEINAKHMKPNSAQYGITFETIPMFFGNYAEAQDFCNEHGISEDEIQQVFVYTSESSVIRNDLSYNAIGKDKDRKLECEESGDRIKRACVKRK